MSFNGFDTEAGKVLADVIAVNNTLQEFNISNTRISAECAAAIANALEINETLRALNVGFIARSYPLFFLLSTWLALKISNNPITTSGALAIIYGIKLNKASNLENLDLTVRFHYADNIKHVQK